MTDDAIPDQPFPTADDERAAGPAPPAPVGDAEEHHMPPRDSPPIEVEPTSDPAGVLAIPDFAASGVTPLVDVTDEGDTEFAPTIDEEARHFGEAAPAPIVCQWCNTPLADPRVEICPHCGGRLQPVADDIDVPGVTTLPSDALEAELRLRRRIQDAAASASARALGDTPAVAPPQPQVLPPVPDGSEVFRPPSDEVARLMREMELEARRAQLEREVPDEVLERAEAAAAQRAAEEPEGADSEGESPSEAAAIENEQPLDEEPRHSPTG